VATIGGVQQGEMFNFSIFMFSIMEDGRILGSHSSGCEEFYHLGFNATWSTES
jgi:hypothetical protein